MRELREESVEAKRFTRGVMRVANVVLRTDCAGRGASSKSSSYSSCQLVSKVDKQTNVNDQTSATDNKFATQAPNSRPAATPSIVSALSTTRRA